MGQQQGVNTHARGRQRGFGTRMPAAYYNHIETFIEIHNDCSLLRVVTMISKKGAHSSAFCW
jgi:hypothetical protein